MTTAAVCRAAAPPAAIRRAAGRQAAIRRALVLALAGPLLVAGCGEVPETGDPSLVLELAISPTPPLVGPARLIITLHDTLGVPLEGARVQVEGEMDTVEITPVSATAEEEGEGRYSVPRFVFTMPGDWILTTRATLPDGRWAQTMTATKVLGPPRDPEPEEPDS